MEDNWRLCFIDNIFAGENYNTEGRVITPGYLLRVQSENATYYPSSYIYLALGEYNALRERLRDRMIRQGQWIFVPKLGGRGYEYLPELDCRALPLGRNDIEPASDVQVTKDAEIREIERDFPTLEDVYSRTSFRMDGKGLLVVSVLKVGQGDFILIRFPSNKGMVIDAYYNKASMKRIHRHISKFFRSTRPHTLLVTHKHLDHTRYVDEIITKYGISECWIGVCSSHPHSSPTIKRIYAALRKKSKKIYGIRNGFEFVDGSFSMRVLYPVGSRCSLDSDQNKHSVILDITWRGKRIILGGDLHNNGWGILYRKFADFPKRIDFFKTPHHCSRTGLASKIVARSDRINSVTSCGDDKRYKHPHCEPLRTYLMVGDHYITKNSTAVSIDCIVNKDGAITVGPNRSVIMPVDCRTLLCCSNCRSHRTQTSKDCSNQWFQRRWPGNLNLSDWRFGQPPRAKIICPKCHGNDVYRSQTYEKIKIGENVHKMPKHEYTYTCLDCGKVFRPPMKILKKFR